MWHYYLSCLMMAWWANLYSSVGLSCLVLYLASVGVSCFLMGFHVSLQTWVYSLSAGVLGLLRLFALYYAFNHQEYYSVSSKKKRKKRSFDPAWEINNTILHNCIQHLQISREAITICTVHTWNGALEKKKRKKKKEKKRD